MNGRIYDPMLGRMLSADRVIQSPANLQSYNRYSYVINNPMLLIDPTGYVHTIFLDGTSNNNSPKTFAKGKETNVSILANLYRDTPNQTSFYTRGVGTGDGALNVFGLVGGTGADARLDDAMESIQVAYDAGERDFAIVGFSRGAAMSLDLSNRMSNSETQASHRGLGVDASP